MEQHEDFDPPEIYLVDSWDELVSPFIPEGLQDRADEILWDTFVAYSETHREYHTLDHVRDCLEKLSEYSGREDYLQLWLALLWHDVVYDTHASDNEEQSAKQAKAWMKELQLPGADTVERLILSTKHHNPEQEDEALLCAIDMSILAEPEPVYDAYTVAIRQEFKWVDDERFIAGRLVYLESFKNPFQHPDFLHLNEAAHVNVEREKQLINA